jgi:hypothetical protein
MESTLIRVGAVIALGLGLAACSKGSGSYSILASGQSFKQATASGRTDLLFVIDNSGSMSPLQQNLTNNFNSFIQQFVTKGYDFQLAVTTSDAYLAGAFWDNDPTRAKFRDGVGSIHTGVFTILPSTPNLINTFVTNASQGSGGSGDERIFSSFKAALSSPLNSGFVRQNSFLGVVILSDEDDFSNPTRKEGDFSTGDHDYNQPGLETVDSYISYLDGLTGTTGATRRYTVSAITVLDQACQTQHAQAAPTTIIGQRYIDMANKTGGVLGSVCDTSFANSMQKIQQRIVELSSQFYLDAKPVDGSISVVVNGVTVPQDGTDGWSYDPNANSVVFHGAAVPAAGASIAINFDPQSVQF